jgi:hypothetical protein
MENLAVPFLTRDMLAFQEGTAFSLVLKGITTISDDLTIRGFTKEGIFTLKYHTVGDGNPETKTFNLPDIPIFVQISDESLHFPAQSTYFNLFLALNGSKVGQLCAGNISVGQSISWPNTQFTQARPGGGYLRVATVGSAPAAGIEFGDSLAGDGLTWKLQGIRIRLVTSAAAANRRPHFILKHTATGKKLLEFFSDIDQTAGQTIDYQIQGVGVIPDSLDNSVIIVPMPNNILINAAIELNTLTTNLQAGDQWAAPVVYAEEWLEIV